MRYFTASGKFELDCRVALPITSLELGEVADRALARCAHVLELASVELNSSAKSNLKSHRSPSINFANGLLTAWHIPMPDAYNAVALLTIPNSLKK